MTTAKAKGRTFKEFEKDLTPAEKILLAKCREGEPAIISNERPAPENKTAENTVRAEFVRFLALGGDDIAPVHEHGVHLHGAWIEGELQMRSAVVPSDLGLTNCGFSHAPQFFHTEIDGTLSLEGARVPGFNGDRMDCKGGLYLRTGFTADGVVRLLGAQIGGDLDCGGATFNGKVSQTKDGKAKYGFALVADGINVKGSIFLNKGFTATGEVHLLSVQVEGQFNCSDAIFDGKIGEREEGKRRGYALCAENMKVGVFFFRKLKNPVGDISLAASHVRVLADDEESWGKGLLLDGFTYGSIATGSPTSAEVRLAWLDKQSLEDAGLDGKGEEFKPQPWRQLIKVMREMGHAEDARQMAINFEHRLREACLIGQPPAHWGKWRSEVYRFIVRFGHLLLWAFTGFGYRPVRLLAWMVGVWLAYALFYLY